MGTQPAAEPRTGVLRRRQALQRPLERHESGGDRAARAADRKALERLQAFDREALSEADKLHYDVMLWDLRNAVERQKYREYLRPVSQRGGVQNAEEMAEVLPFATVKDYEDWLSRMRALPTLVEQTTVLMREGVKARNTPPRVLMQRVPAQIKAQLVDDPARSPFFKPFSRFPDAIPQAERERLAAEAKTVIAERIVPAYRDFLRFFEQEYLPNTRTTSPPPTCPTARRITTSSRAASRPPTSAPTASTRSG